MIFRYITLLAEEPLAFLVLFAALGVSMLAGLTFHEFSHALVADGMGDATPRRLGRLTLNPLPHLDPIGSTLIFIVGFGWAKPVPVNPFNARNPKTAMALIAAAGPVSNLVIAGLAGVPIKLGLVPFWHPFVGAFAGVFVQEWTASAGDLLGLFLGTVVLINVLLAVFNLLPLAPLDGFRVAVGLLPDDLSRALASLEPWGIGILMLLIFLPFITNGAVSPLGEVMGPIVDFLIASIAGEPARLRFA